MKEKQFIRLLPIFLFFAFFFTGCAHKPVPSMQSPSDDAPLNQHQQAAAGNTDQNPSSPDRFDDFEKEFLEEEFEARQVHVADPLSSWNRGMFHINDKLYFWVFKPLAKGYKAIAPDFFRFGMKNFFYNLMTPIRFANCIFQGKGNAAASEFTKFVLNTTAGVLGFANPAGQYPELNLSDDEDLGQTFAKYGIGNGFYIVWPVLWPSTLRDSFGLAGDFFLNPLSYVKPIEAELAVKGFDIINRTSFHIGEYEALKEASVDPYIAVRNSYLQFREKKIKQ
jgi:phospholipid-binding lipoprotein MlaA